MNSYKRLTKKDEKGRWVAEAGFYGVYLDNIQPEGKDMIYGDVVDRLAEHEDMVEKIGNRLLPVWIDDHVYSIYYGGGSIALKITQIIFGKHGVMFIGVSDSGEYRELLLCEFGISIFLTEEEAMRKYEKRRWNT